MSVDVVYEGWVMARGVEAKVEGDALFVPAEHALPVGTRVTLRGPEGEMGYRVVRVQESVTPGMMLESMVRKPAVVEPPPAPAPAPAPVPEAASATPTPTPAPADDDDKKSKRRKRKATLT